MTENTAKLCCNRCGRILQQGEKMAEQDFVVIRKQWGYFSKQDGKTMEFCVCEDCMEQWTKEFLIPVKLYDTTELL